LKFENQLTSLARLRAAALRLLLTGSLATCIAHRPASAQMPDLGLLPGIQFTGNSTYTSGPLGGYQSNIVLGDHAKLAWSGGCNWIVYHSGNDSLWYDAAYLDGGMQCSITLQYGWGRNPSVSVNDYGFMVEAHNNTGSDAYWNGNDVWYSGGQLMGVAGAYFSPPQYLDPNAWTPSVSINNNEVVVEVHQQANNNSLFYRVGSYNPTNSAISWGTSFQYDTGYSPCVCLDRTTNTLVEVHNDGSGSNKLWYRVGKVNTSSKTITWSGATNYDNGYWPSVAVNNGKVYETHYDGSLEGSLWEHVGYISGSSIVLSRASYYDSGDWTQGGPSISADNAGVAAVHNGGGTSIFINFE